MGSDYTAQRMAFSDDPMEQSKMVTTNAPAGVDRAAALMEQARRTVALDDFGEDSFRPGLERLAASLEAEARLTSFGQEVVYGQIVDLLCRRLEVEDWYRRHPEIDEQEIVAPLFGLGLPRTGSTALAFLLAEDPAVRFIRSWEASAPCPPPEAATQHTDPRIQIMRQRAAQSDMLFPRLKKMIPISATGPIECQSFMGYDFKSQIFQAMAHIPSYVQWLNYEADLVPTYRYVKRVLKLLQWHCPPNRWRLKNPGHSVFIAALDKVFPDARYWVTHRDIRSVIPSVADLYFEMARPFTETVDKAELGRSNAAWTELGLQRVIAFRDAGHDHRFFDIHFAPFQRDPFPILERLYAFLGEDFTTAARTRMETWRRDTPRDKHGALTYDAAEFGIDLDCLRTRFKFYSDRFGIEQNA